MYHMKCPMVSNDILSVTSDPTGCTQYDGKPCHSKHLKLQEVLYCGDCELQYWVRMVGWVGEDGEVVGKGWSEVG